MEVANTLAYYGMAKITAVKSFIIQALGVDPINKCWSKFTLSLSLSLYAKPFQ
jgi:hypothetical protein